MPKTERSNLSLKQVTGCLLLIVALILALLGYLHINNQLDYLQKQDISLQHQVRQLQRERGQVLGTEQPGNPVTSQVPGTSMTEFGTTTGGTTTHTTHTTTTTTTTAPGSTSSGGSSGGTTGGGGTGGGGNTGGGGGTTTPPPICVLGIVCL